MPSSDKPDTLLVHAGRDPAGNHGIVNPPVYHASTILFPSLAELEAIGAGRKKGYSYGRRGTPTSDAFEQAVAALEGGAGAVSLSSGLAAVTTALLAYAEAGSQVLMVDTAYGPTRTFCGKTLTRLGVETVYYDPLIGAGIADLITDRTRVVYMESPGSQTFEVQDVPAITAAARARGVATMLDNTWATPLLFRPFDHGVDLSIHAATKYIVGHSDANLGVVVARDEAALRTVRACAGQLGQCVGPDDLYLGLRGLRTMSVRLRRHEASALRIAEWLRSRPEVDRVLHPALPDDPGHALWRRDFTGASGLFSIVLKPVRKAAVAAMLDGMTLFPMGYSWGGYESLITLFDPRPLRTATSWPDTGPCLRLHIGLEDPDDLVADLARGFDRLNAAS